MYWLWWLVSKELPVQAVTILTQCPIFQLWTFFFFDIRVAPIIAKKNSKNKMTRTKVVVE